jgi:hypothetical protein
VKKLAAAVVVLLVLVGAGLLLKKRSTIANPSQKEAPSGGERREPGQRPEREAVKARADKAPTAAGRLLHKGKWGNGDGEFGHKEANESNPEGPMSMVAGKGGLLVLDQVNSRVMRFGPDGKPLGSFPIGPDTARDLAIDDKGRVAVLDRVGQGEVALYDESGKLTGQAPVAGGPMDEAGGATGIFTGGGGTWVEREHTESVRILGPDGQPDPDRPTLPGRPLRGGGGSIQAAVISKPAGTAYVRVFDDDFKVVWQRTVSFPAPIVQILLLDSDLGGWAYLGVHVAVENPEPPHLLEDERIIVVRLARADGADGGSIVVPALTGPDEVANPLAVGDDGTIYLMTPGPDGLEIHAYTFPP